MSVSILIDMNLSVEWVHILEAAGWKAEHWLFVGDPRASDATIMSWALTHQFVVFTLDMDFGAALAATRAGGPSVIQVRGVHGLTQQIGVEVLAALRLYDAALSTGALVVVEKTRARVRGLPLEPDA